MIRKRLQRGTEYSDAKKNIEKNNVIKEAKKKEQTTKKKIKTRYKIKKPEKVTGLLHVHRLRLSFPQTRGCTCKFSTIIHGKEL